MGILNHYPDDILEEHNKYRHVKIFVKRNKSMGQAAQDTAALVKDRFEKLKESYSKNSFGGATESELKGVSKAVAAIDPSETEYGIALPLPNELSDSQTHDWETSAGAVHEVLTGTTGVTNVLKGVNEVLAKNGARQVGIDPGYFQNYNGTTPREFSFTWEFVPDNSMEAKNISFILLNLKKYTLPTTGRSGVSMLSPFTFDIEISNDWIDNIMCMNNLVCKSMEINYASDGGLQFLPDGAPKFVTLTMTFAEKTPITANFYM